MHIYGLYGLRLRSAWRFPYPEGAAASLPEVVLDRGPASLFEKARAQATIPPTDGNWVTVAALADQAIYVRWEGLLEAVVSRDGRTICCRAFSGAPPEALHSYLLGAALSFALIKLGIEPLHSTVAVVDGVAVGLMGDCGYGKSSLGAAFLRNGHQLLTDDLLVVSDDGRAFHAHPGAPRIKLFPAIARRIFGRQVAGTPMNTLTPKMIIPLTTDQSPRAAVALAAIYVLSRPRRPSTRSTRTGVRIRALTKRAACIELIRNTFNMAVTDPERLERQLSLTGAVASRVPVKRLSYPRIPSMLAAAREAILADLGT